MKLLKERRKTDCRKVTLREEEEEEEKEEEGKPSVRKWKNEN